MARRICAWCDADMGPSNTKEDTHGICGSCHEKMRSDIAAKKEENSSPSSGGGYDPDSNPNQLW